jgi:hypothetical protein
MPRDRYPLAGAVSLLLLAATTAATAPADKPADELKDKIEKADIVVVGKVTQTGLSSASSFDVGVIEVSEVLKGKEDTKTVNFKFASSGNGNVAPYGKKGVEGVWVLGTEGKYMSAREVLSFQPLKELDAVKKLLPKKEKPSD